MGYRIHRKRLPKCRELNQVRIKKLIHDDLLTEFSKKTGLPVSSSCCCCALNQGALLGFDELNLPFELIKEFENSS